VLGGVAYPAAVEITGSAAMTRALYGRVLRAGLRRIFLSYRLIGGCALVGVVLALLGGRPSSPLTIGLIAGGVVLVLMPELMAALGNRRVAGGQVWRYRVSPAGAGQTSPAGDFSVAWSNVKQVDEVAVGWVLRLRTTGFLVLPREAFDPAVRPHVAALVTARGPAPAP
jgi:hypothetical protein